MKGVSDIAIITFVLGSIVILSGIVGVKAYMCGPSVVSSFCKHVPPTYSLRYEKQDVFEASLSGINLYPLSGKLSVDYSIIKHGDKTSDCSADYNITIGDVVIANGTAYSSIEDTVSYDVMVSDIKIDCESMNNANVSVNVGSPVGCAVIDTVPDNNYASLSISNYVSGYIYPVDVYDYKLESVSVDDDYVVANVSYFGVADSKASCTVYVSPDNKHKVFIGSFDASGRRSGNNYVTYRSTIYSVRIPDYPSKIGSVNYTVSCYSSDCSDSNNDYTLYVLRGRIPSLNVTFIYSPVSGLSPSQYLDPVSHFDNITSHTLTEEYKSKLFDRVNSVFTDSSYLPESDVYVFWLPTYVINISASSRNPEINITIPVVNDSLVDEVFDRVYSGASVVIFADYVSQIFDSYKHALGITKPVLMDTGPSYVELDDELKSDLVYYSSDPCACLEEGKCYLSSRISFVKECSDPYHPGKLGAIYTSRFYNFTTTTARVLAHYKDIPLVTINNYGNGKVVVVQGSVVSTVDAPERICYNTNTQQDVCNNLIYLDSLYLSYFEVVT